MDTYPDPLGNYKFLMADVYGSPNQTMGFFENEGMKGADLPTNSELLNIDKDCDSECMAKSVHSWMKNIPENRWSNWMVRHLPFFYKVVPHSAPFQKFFFKRTARLIN